MEDTHRHETSISLVGTPSAPIAAGSDITLKAIVSCPSSTCDLRDAAVAIFDSNNTVVKEVEVAGFDGAVNETGQFTLKAPMAPGEYRWEAVFPEQTLEGSLHGECRTQLSFVVKPHATSMTIWDVPSPIALNGQFSIKVGVRCAAKCVLAGVKVDVYDGHDAKVATAILDDAPWPPAGVMYWTEIALVAPPIQGSYDWKIKLTSPDLALAHEESDYPFTFATADPPDHNVSVEVVDKDSKTPLSNAYITLHASGGFPYRGRTNEAGAATVRVPKGDYKLYVVRQDYKDFETTATVGGDVAVKAELRFAPDTGA